MAKFNMRDFDRMMAGADQKEKHEAEEARMKRFDAALGGKFQFVPKGVNFKTDIDGVKSISMLAPPEGGTAIQIVVFAENKQGKESSVTLSLTPDGKRLGWEKLLKGKADANEVFEAVLEMAESISPEFWIEVEDDVFKKGVEEPGDKGVGDGRERGVGEREDLERIEFLTSQESAVFGFYTGSGAGFNGYRGVVFDGFVVLDSPNVGNAAYIIEGTPSISKEDGLTEEEKKAWVKEHVTSQTKHKSRRDLRDEGAQQIIHRGDWKKRMQEAIDQRLQPGA